MSDDLANLLISQEKKKEKNEFPVKLNNTGGFPERRKKENNEDNFSKTLNRNNEGPSIFGNGSRRNRRSK